MVKSTSGQQHGDVARYHREVQGKVRLSGLRSTCQGHATSLMTSSCTDSKPELLTFLHNMDKVLWQVFQQRVRGNAALTSSVDHN
eukprot:3065662-Amphidinium_carterae.1